jgi:hypothetical protein
VDARTTVAGHSRSAVGASSPCPGCRQLLTIGILILCGLLLSSHSGVVNYLFPVFAVAAGLVLLRSSPADYTSFTLWLWLLAPLVRRLVDFRSATSGPPLILLAPYLASCIPLYYLLRNRGARVDRTSAPLFYMGAAVTCGLIVGGLNFPLAAVLEALLTWIAPICFAFFVYGNRKHFQNIFHSFETTMIHGTLLIGTYGIYQYFALPPWDVFWMEHTPNVVVGLPQPMEVRIFSTMNAPQILALFLTVGVLLALRSKSTVRLLVAPVGALALALTLTRTAWISFLVGLTFLV